MKTLISTLAVVIAATSVSADRWTAQENGIKGYINWAQKKNDNHTNWRVNNGLNKLNVIKQARIDHIVKVSLAKASIVRTQWATDFYDAEVQAIHNDGYAGQGVDVWVIDHFTGVYRQHGLNVEKTVKTIAPLANIKGLGVNLYYGAENTLRHTRHRNKDVINASLGYNAMNGFTLASNNLTQYQNSASVKQGTANKWGDEIRLSGALAVVALGNSSDKCESLLNTTCNLLVAGATGSVDTTVFNKSIDGVDYHGVGFEYKRDADNLGIAAGALEEDGSLASYSSLAGMFAEDTLFARVGLGGYAGTSFAAPVISGAAALVMDKFDTTSAQTKSILLGTATDLGAPGVDSIFGHGELNITAALSPVGSLK